MASPDASRSRPEPRGHASISDLEVQIGENLRKLRLDRNVDQATLAQRAGVGLRSLQRLEHGQGSTTHTLLSVMRALDREDWLRTIAPVATINPLTMPRTATPRLRARKRRFHDQST